MRQTNIFSHNMNCNSNKTTIFSNIHIFNPCCHFKYLYSTIRLNCIREFYPSPPFYPLLSRFSRRVDFMERKRLYLGVVPLEFPIQQPLRRHRRRLHRFACVMINMGLSPGVLCHPALLCEHASVHTYQNFASGRRRKR